jgi:hypothetical protein
MFTLPMQADSIEEERLAAARPPSSSADSVRPK